MIRPIMPTPSSTRAGWPIVTLLLSTILTLIYLWQSGLDAYQDSLVVHVYGLLPAHLWGLRIPPTHLQVIPPVATLITAQFLHGGMTCRCVGGIRNPSGRLRYLIVFLVAGALGLLVEAAATPSSVIPIIGASAAVAGVIGALARRDPGARVRLPWIGHRHDTRVGLDRAERKVFRTDARTGQSVKQGGLAYIR